MDADINMVSEKLVNCLSLIMNPQVDQIQRQEAYKICEEFKESSPLCAQCGLLLSERGRPPIIRHFGLQLIEHCIKFRWNNMSQQEKVYIKNNALTLLASGTDSVLVEEAYIKDALSRIIVEMIKREWPQQWPSLLPELDEICSMGETQTELVLLIFLRLAEDIVTFQNVQSQRRKEIYQMMSSNLKDIFPFFLRTLKDQFTKYNQHKQGTENINKQQMLVHARVAEVVLKTLSGFVEWVQIAHITTNNSLLLSLLCMLLGDDLLQMAAAECLLLLVGRKGTVEERKSLLHLFEPEAMSVIFAAASSADNLRLEEQHYLFLKKLCQVLTNLGLQLTSLLGVVDGVEEPPTFPVYLNSILSFTRHPSRVLSCYTQSLWSSLCQNARTSVSEPLKAILPEIVKISTEKLLRVGYPSKNDSPSCAYSRIDFDSDEEFLQFYHKYRVEVLDVLRQITVLQPEVCLRVGEQWLQTLVLETEKSQQNMQDSIMSSLQLQWDGLEEFFEGINHIFMCKNRKPPLEEGLRLLEALLGVETKDPAILSSLLSCISSFFTILTMDARLLPRVLDKVFPMVVFLLPGETKATRSKAVRKVRRHACSFLIRICKQFASVVLPAFGHMYKHIKSISEDPQQLSQMEKCALHEALVLISNELCDYEKQCNFLGEIMAPVLQVWHSAEIKMAFSSVEAFIAHIGLDKDPPALGEDICAANRSAIMYCVLMIMCVIKRTAYPVDAEAAEKGGFLYPQEINASGKICRNPAAPHIIPLLGGLFSLIRVLNSLFSHEARLRINLGYATALDMLEAAKDTLLGTSNHRNPSDVDKYGDFLFTNNKSSVERMKNFLTFVHENCFHSLGSAPQNFGLEFYATPGLLNFIGTDACACVDCLPDYRLRYFNCCFVKSFFQYCPPSHYSMAIAVLEVLSPFMYQKISTRWEKFRQVHGTSIDYEDETTELQEILEDQQNRQLTREYIKILGTILIQKRTEHCSLDIQEISELGQLILRKDSLRPAIIMTLFSCIHWSDTCASVRALHLCPAVLKQLVKDSMISQETEVTYLLHCVSLGLREHGEHEANQALLVNTALLIYESLRPHFPAINETLVEITGCCKQQVQNFDEILKKHAAGKPPLPDKKKRELFKKLVSGIIGKNVGQHHKREMQIKNLPPLFLPPRPKNCSVDEVEKKDIGLCRLFSDKPGDCDTTASSV